MFVCYSGTIVICSHPCSSTIPLKVVVPADIVVPLSTTMNEQPECTQVGSVKQLIEELREIVDWRLLGEGLGVETNRLQQIDSGNIENEHKKRAMIRYVMHVNIVAFPQAPIYTHCLQYARNVY